MKNQTNLINIPREIQMDIAFIKKKNPGCVLKRSRKQIFLKIKYVKKKKKN